MSTKLVLHTVLDDLAESQPDLVAIEDRYQQINYRQLKEYSRSVAGAVQALGLGKGNVAAVYMRSSIAYVVAICGVNKAGGIFMPLELNYPAERIGKLLQEVRPGLILTLRSELEELGRIISENSPDAAPVILLMDEYQAGIFTSIKMEDAIWATSRQITIDGKTLPVTVDGEDSNYLIYTSGSTGVPKIIEGVHKSLSHFIHWEVKEFALDNSVRVSQLAPLSFDVSFRDIFVPLLAGGTLCIPPDEVRKDPALLLDWLEEQRVDHIHTVPSLFRMQTELVASKGSVKVRHLKRILLAGEALYNRDVLRWRSVAGEGTELVNLYGPSETTLAKIFNRIGEIDGSPGDIIPLGKPIPNCAVLVLQNERLSKAGAIGEIYIKTPFRSKGYYKDPVMTKEKFIQNPLHADFEDIVYKTGDMGKYLPDGNLAFVGRQDRQIKIRGNRVELFEVEQTLQTFPGINQLLVHSYTNRNLDTYMVLYYTSEHEIEGDLRSALRDLLPEYMHPSFYCRLPEFPLSLNGKIDKNQLPRPEELLYQSLPYEAPQNDQETKIARIWSQALGIDKIGRNNSFFELGGHSLSAFRAVSLLCKEFDKDISLKEFFDFPTVSGLADLINEKSMNEIII